MSIQKVIKRSGEEVVFQPEKIRIALQKANKEVSESLQADEGLIDQILQTLFNSSYYYSKNELYILLSLEKKFCSFSFSSLLFTSSS